MSRTGTDGRPVRPLPDAAVHVVPPLVVFQTFGVLKPPKVTYTVLMLLGSTRIRVTKRAGSGLLPICVHVGAAGVPFVALWPWPWWGPTQTMLVRRLTP